MSADLTTRARRPVRTPGADAGKSRRARPGLAPEATPAWSRSPWNPLVTDASPRMLETVLAVGLVADGLAVPGAGIPLAELTMLLLLGVAAFRPPRVDLSRYTPLALGAAALLVYLAVVTLANGLDPSRRGLRLGLLTLLIYAIASERLDIKGILYGMTAGALLNVPLFYAGLAPDAYQGYLTGFLGDKNVAGLFYAILPILLVATLQRMRTKLLVLGGGLALTFLTGSRTSLAALACATVWIFVSPYLGRLLRLLLVGGMAWVVSWAEENLAALGIFGDRSGTDWFRERIQEASAEKVAEGSFFGQGLSTAYVDLENVTMFFHNSYLGLLVEGGWPFLVAVVGLYLWLCLRPFAQTRRSPSRVAVEAGTVIVFITSTELGEVFLTIFGAVVLGCGLLLTAQEAEEADELSAAEAARRRRPGASWPRPAGGPPAGAPPVRAGDILAGLPRRGSVHSVIDEAAARVSPAPRPGIPPFLAAHRVLRPEAAAERTRGGRAV